MKIELRIPAEEQYAYIGLEFGDAEVITDEMIDAAVQDYHRATRRLRGGEGLPRVEWNAVLDALNMGKPMDVEVFEKMSQKQREFYHEQEKSISRLKGKE